MFPANWFRSRSKKPSPRPRTRLGLERLEDRVVPSGDIPALHSNPGAPAALYLDFDGHFEASWLGYSNITTPVFDGKDTFFASSAYDSGSRAIKLAKKDGRIVPEELWYSRKMRVHHGNVILIGDYVYGSTGTFAPAFLAAVNINTGEIPWRERGFAPFRAAA